MGPRTGVQIAVAMTRRDEGIFLDWLRTTARVQLLARNGPVGDSIWLDRFPRHRRRDRFHSSFALWNQAFDWEPRVQVRQFDVGIRNIAHAPVIEYDRHPFSNPAPYAGRLYWSRTLGEDWFTSAGTEESTEFARWWDTVRSWVVTQTRGRSPAGVHYLPDAWRRYGRWGRG